MVKPTVFITNFHPFTTRNIFDTGVLDLIAQGATRVIAFVPKNKEELMRRLYQKHNITIEGFDDSSLTKGRESLFYPISETLIDTRTKRDHQLKYRLASKHPLRHIKYYLGMLSIRTLGQATVVKKLFRVLENRFYRPKHFQKYFEQYHPNLVFVTDLFAQTDTLLLKETKQKNVKTVALVRSWDNTTNKSLLRIIPDRVIVQNEIMKDEMVKLHAISSSLISVVGVPQFEYYLRYQPIGREEFCKSLGLDPQRRIVLFAPAGDKFIGTDWQTCDILKRLQQEQKIPQDVQFLVRTHPHHFTDFSQFVSTVNFVIDDLGADIKKLKPKEVEIDLSAVNHLADSLYHSVVVINVVSSLVVDAAIFDKPVITIGFNGWEAKVPYLRSVERVLRQEWLTVLNDSGVAPTVYNPQQLADQLNKYLAHPEKDKELRDKFIKEHCYKFDGHAVERMASAVLDND